MKNLFLVLPLLYSLGTMAATGSELLMARDAAIDEASIELDIDKVSSFKITPEAGGEVEVSFKDDKEVHVFGCHLHGNQMACHSEDDGHKLGNKSAPGDFDHIIEGHTAGLIKLEKTLRRRGADLNILESIKVWKLSEEDSGGNGHEHGADVWTKVTYELGNKNLIVFIQCHEHEEKEEGFACHYKKTAKEEPSL